MSLAAPLAFLLIAAPQGPGDGPAPGEVGKFRWPPRIDNTLHYEAKFTKERKLPADIAKKEREARKAANLFAPRKPPRQSVAVAMQIELASEKDKVTGTYQTTLGKQSLRMKVGKPKKTGTKSVVEATLSTGPFLGNDRLTWVWGLPSDKSDPLMHVDRGLVDRRFRQVFERTARQGAKPTDLRKHFGDHLLPVIWDYPLPCWIGAFVAALELNGEAVIEGKALLREATQVVTLGYRQTRAKGKWTAASASAFTLQYRIEVEQNVAQERDGRKLLGESSFWLFEVEGVATYSFADQAWDSIQETVTARPKELTDEKLRRLHDEVFCGTIEIQRVQPRDARRKGTRRR